MKEKETLEEVLKNGLEFVHNSCRNFDFDLGFKTRGLIGAKWQQERMYSEEDLKQFAFECVANFLSNNDNKVEIKLVDVIIDKVKE